MHIILIIIFMIKEVKIILKMFKYKKFTLFFITLSTCITFLFLGGIVGSYIFATDNVPTISIGGQSDTNLTIFRSGEHLWYPGYETSGVLRVRNDLGSKITLNNLGMKINLSKDGEAIDTNSDKGKYYMDKMRIKVEYKNPIKNFLNGTIYDENYKSTEGYINSFAEFIKGVACNIKLGRNDYVDLVYTVKMDESADITIAGITGITDFTVSVAEISTDNGDIDDGDGDIGKDKGDEVIDDELVEEPIEEVPDIGGHWAHDCIEILLEKGIVTGYPDGTIKPENYITRVEAAVLIARALDIKPDDAFISPYTDKLPEWGIGYINALTRENIYYGYPDKTFRASNNITREEMTAILIRAFDKKVERHIELPFLDNEDIGPWAVKYIKAGVQNEVILGYPDGTFKPKNNITRAEAFTLICRLLGLHEEHKIKN